MADPCPVLSPSRGGEGRGGVLLLLGTLIALLWCAGAAAAATAPPIVAIHFEGNETTKPRVMLQEMTVHVGDPADPAAIERSRQAIMDLGLFKSVTAQLENAPGGEVLVITVEEKFYILPLPRLDGKPNGDYQYGAELRFDNLAGLNQRLKLLYLVHNSLNSSEPQRKETGVEYGYPRLAGTAYDLGLNLSRNEESLEDLAADGSVIARYQRDIDRTGVNLARWLQRNGPSRGWRVGGGLALERWHWSRVRGLPGLHVDSQAVGLLGSVGYQDVHDYGFYREGSQYGWSGELAVPQVGSDYSYSRNLLYYRSYNPLGRYQNLNWQFQMGLANGNRFGAPAFAVGGRTLHGYKSHYAEGNAFLLSNLEYLHPISGYRQLRGVVLFDAGNAFQRTDQLDPTNLKLGAGLGFRWRFQSFVNINLAFDWGYGFASKEQFTYFTTTGTF